MEIRKNGIALPIVALGLDFAPVLIILLNSIIRGGVLASALLFAVLLPVAGLITGIVSLSLWKDRIGKIGKILAIVAISLPVALVLFIIVIFVGAVTGLISLM
jgi:hypothetical protein